MSFFNNNLFQTLNNSFDETNSYKKIISEEGIKKIQYLKYNSKLFKNDTFCPITQKKFTENCKIAKLPCEHIFEPSGILFWLKNEKPSCPVCRYNFDYIEIKNNVSNIDISNNTDISNIDISNIDISNNTDISNNFGNFSNNIFEFSFNIGNLNNLNIRYSLENLLNDSFFDVSNSDVSNNQATVLNLDISNNEANVLNSDISNNTQLRNNIFNTIENEIINTFTNIYFRRQEEIDLEKALLNSLQDQ